MRYEYTDPSGDVRADVPVDELRRLILEFPSEYWREGSGDASLRHSTGAELLILPNEHHGIYLKYSPDGFQGDAVLLSLHDHARLSEVAECGDEWFASLGLFLALTEAWNAIAAFLENGAPSDAVRWCTPADLPDEGNW